MKYTIFWLDGRTEIVTGNTPANACSNAGLSAAAVRAMDFYATGDQRDKYVWNKERHAWKSKENFVHDR